MRINIINIIIIIIIIMIILITNVLKTEFQVGNMSYFQGTPEERELSFLSLHPLPGLQHLYCGQQQVVVPMLRAKQFQHTSTAKMFSPSL